MAGALDFREQYAHALMNLSHGCRSTAAPYADVVPLRPRATVCATHLRYRT
jgi:hypothetical protein